jgi:hypothetical protein
MYSALRSEEKVGMRGNLAKMQQLKTCFDADLSQECPLTSILSPKGRGGKREEPQLD